MSATTFDTLRVARELKAAGVPDEQAEAHAAALRQAATADHNELATKTDIAALRADLIALESRLDARLYRALWIQGAGIVAILTALRFLPL